MVYYKDSEDYKVILSMGYIDITAQSRSKKTTIVFQHKDELAREKEMGDTKYIVQESGYVRRSVMEKNGKYNMNGKIIDKFRARSSSYPLDGLSLLKTYLEIKHGMIQQKDGYKMRAEVKIYAIMNAIFNTKGHNQFIQYLTAGKTYNNNDDRRFERILNQLDDPKKKYQAIVRISKELGI